MTNEEKIVLSIYKKWQELSLLASKKESKEEQYNYDCYKAILATESENGAKCWDDLLQVYKILATFFFLKSDQGSEIIAECEGLSNVIADEFFRHIFLEKNPTGNMKRLIIKAVGNIADKTFFKCK